MSHDGMFDLASANLETEELWFPNWEFKGWPWNSDQYRKWNPMLFAEKFKTPDARHHERARLPRAVRAGPPALHGPAGQGVASKLLTFPDEGHWVLKPGNSCLWHTTVMDWLHRYLGGAEADPKALETAYSVTK